MASTSHSFAADKQFDKPPAIEIREVLSPVGSDVELAVKSPRPQNVKSWPSEPQSTRFSWEYELAMNLSDVILCIVPIGLIIKAGLCVLAAHLDFKEGHVGNHIDSASYLSKNLLEFNKQLTTIFTIFFLVIIATLFKRMALWKSQHGATLAELELLQASVSPASTIRVMFSLRIFTVTSILMACTWVWYYVGSQAAQMEFTIQHSASPSSWQLATISADALSPYEDGTWRNYSQIQNTDMTARFHVYSQDTRGELFDSAIADVEQDALPLMFADEDADLSFSGWTKVENRQDWQLASSMGARYYVNNLTVANPEYDRQWYSRRMLGSWSYNTSLIDVKCSNLALSDEKAPLGLLPAMSISMNMTNSSSDSEQQRSFHFWQRYNDTNSLTATCNVAQANIENFVVCSSAACKVSKVRTRPGFKNPSPRSLLFDNNDNARAFFDGLLYACGTPSNLQDRSTFELDDGLSPLLTAIGSDEYEKGTLAAELLDYEDQLSLMSTKYINTFWAASKYLRYDHEIDKMELTTPQGNFTLDTTDPDWNVFNVEAAEYMPHYAISWPWIAVDIVSCLVLFVAAVAAFWLRKRTQAPDILGYVSSMTRENPMLDVPGGSALGGMERTRKMKHVMVKLGEIPTRDGYGRIGLTYVLDEHNSAHNLEKGKLYV